LVERQSVNRLITRTRYHKINQL